MTRPRPKRNQPPPPPLSQTLAARLQAMVDDMIRREKALARRRKV